MGAGAPSARSAPLPLAEAGRAAVVAATLTAALAAKLREVCALMLAEGAPDPELAAWCRRMVSEPGAAESAVSTL